MNNTLTPYRATDRRVYNVAPCPDMHREWEHAKYLEERMKISDPTASCTYFPMEDKWMVFINSNLLKNPRLVGPPKELTGNFHNNLQEALIEAIEVLEKRK